MSDFNLKGAQLVGQRRIFTPAPATDMRMARAIGKINVDQATAVAWHDVFQAMGRTFQSGEDVFEWRVPKGGLEVLHLCGYHATLVREEPNGDTVRVCLTDPFHTMRVLS